MYPVYALFHYFPEIFGIRITLTVILLCICVIVSIILYKKGKIDKHGMVWLIALWIYFLFILYITVLGRYTFDGYRARVVLFESYRQLFATGNIFELKGIIYNIIMFIPFSFLVAELLKDKKPIFFSICAGVLFTFLIEFLQFVSHTGTFEIDDIIHNTFGVIIGLTIWNIVYKLRQNR